jgi:large subunit ribosomal protein L4
MATAKKTISKKKSEAPVKKTVKVEKAAYVAQEAAIYSMEGKKVGSIALPEGIFGISWRSDLVHQVTTAMQANLRQNRAHTKDRAEVSGGGRKPWKQKGTGQARHSSTRSPIWRHGGVTFGPRSTRNYSEKINRRMRIGALLSVLSRKAKNGEIIFVDTLNMSTPKTAVARVMLEKLAKGADVADLATKKNNAALLALSSYNTSVVKSFHNFGNVLTEEVRNLNPVDVLTHKYLIIENPEVAFTVLLARAKAK